MMMSLVDFSPTFLSLCIHFSTTISWWAWKIILSILGISSALMGFSVSRHSGSDWGGILFSLGGDRTVPFRHVGCSVEMLFLPTRHFSFLVAFYHHYKCGGVAWHAVVVVVGWLVSMFSCGVAGGVKDVCGQKAEAGLHQHADGILARPDSCGCVMCSWRRRATTV